MYCIVLCCVTTRTWCCSDSLAARWADFRPRGGRGVLSSIYHAWHLSLSVKPPVFVSPTTLPPPPAQLAGGVRAEGEKKKPIRTRHSRPFTHDVECRLLTGPIASRDRHRASPSCKADLRSIEHVKTLVIKSNTLLSFSFLRLIATALSFSCLRREQDNSDLSGREASSRLLLFPRVFAVVCENFKFCAAPQPLNTKSFPVRAVASRFTTRRLIRDTFIQY